MHAINLHISRHLAHNFLDIRQYACKISVQSDEKSDCVSDAQVLCGIALTDPLLTIRLSDQLYIENDGKLYVYQSDDISASKSEREIIEGPVISGYDETAFHAAFIIKDSLIEYEVNVHMDLALVDNNWKVSGYQESFDSTESGIPNNELAMDILEDLRQLDSLRVGVELNNIEKEITSTIVDDNGYEYVYYKVSDEYENENFKNSVEDIKSWVDNKVTGEAYENLFKSIYAETESGKPAMFREFEDGLYYLFGLREAPFRWFGDPQIKNAQNGSFDIVVCCYAAEESNMVKDLIVHVEKEGYGWKISKCEYDESSLRVFTEE